MTIVSDDGLVRTIIGRIFPYDSMAESKWLKSISPEPMWYGSLTRFWEFESRRASWIEFDRPIYLGTYLEN